MERLPYPRTSSENHLPEDHQDGEAPTGVFEQPDDTKLPSFADKVSMTPLTLETMRDLINRIPAEDDKRLLEMNEALDRLAKSAQDGDHITLNDLQGEARDSKVTDAFAVTFEEDPRLIGMGDSIDAYTEHPDVPTQQKNQAREVAAVRGEIHTLLSDSAENTAI